MTATMRTLAVVMMLALGATIHTNKRDIAADDFFTGMFETALEEDEIVTAVSFSAPDVRGVSAAVFVSQTKRSPGPFRSSRPWRRWSLLTWPCASG